MRLLEDSPDLFCDERYGLTAETRFPFAPLTPKSWRAKRAKGYRSGVFGRMNRPRRRVWCSAASRQVSPVTQDNNATCSHLRSDFGALAGVPRETQTDAAADAPGQ